jgi:hypothetical protein
MAKFDPTYTPPPSSATSTPVRASEPIYSRPPAPDGVIAKWLSIGDCTLALDREGNELGGVTGFKGTPRAYVREAPTNPRFPQTRMIPIGHFTQAIDALGAVSRVLNDQGGKLTLEDHYRVARYYMSEERAWKTAQEEMENHV